MHEWVAAVRVPLGIAVLLVLAACGNESLTSPFEVDRPPEPLAGPALVTLLCAGDTIDRDGHDPARDPDPLGEVAHLLAQPDVLLLNHEGTLAGPRMACTGWPWNAPLTAPPATAAWYVRAPVNLATLANNHVLDCGREGLPFTVETLEAHGILTVGAGKDLFAACAPRTVSVRGQDITFLSYHAYDLEVADGNPYPADEGTPGVAEWDACAGASTVAAWKAAGHLVVVALHLHLGPSYVTTTWPRHRARVMEALDAGADLVVGHGAHVPQGLVAHNGGLGFLCLGNFLFRPGYEVPAEAKRAIVASVAVHDDALAVTLHPLLLDNYGRPRPAGRELGRLLLDRIARASVEGGVDLEIWDGRAYAAVPRNP